MSLKVVPKKVPNKPIKDKAPVKEETFSTYIKGVLGPPLYTIATQEEERPLWSMSMDDFSLLIGSIFEDLEKVKSLWKKDMGITSE